MEEDNSPMVEMFTRFPHESAVVMQRGIEFGIMCSSFLVSHCWMLVLQFWSSNRYSDTILRAFCVARIVCALPRPYFWFHTRKLFVEARDQPTPQMITQRLLDIYAHPFAVERGLLCFYYAWLACTTAVVRFMHFEGDSAVEPHGRFVQELWRHCLLNFASIILHRVMCVILFYYLMNSDLKRGITVGVLNRYSARLVFHADRAEVAGSDPECSICFGRYSEGDEMRKLRCGHIFHRECVDVWLLEHQNRCPLCVAVVGPAEALAPSR